MKRHKLKTLFFPLIVFLLVAGSLSVRPLAAGVPEILSETAILIDAETGQVLYQKNPDKTMYPASTTKIMTGLLVAENVGMNEIARVSKSAVDIDEWDSANIGLVEDEEMSVDNLMYGMMMPSANDASNVLAEHVSGSQDAFSAMMTARARAIGAENTRFANAHGLHDPGHYTTARDLAMITREAVKNETFMRYFGTGNRTVPPTNKTPYERRFENYQFMLVPTSEYYDPEVTGGKVGYTHEAQHTMSTIAERGGRRLICVVMKTPNRGDKFADTRKLLDFGFEEFSGIRIAREQIPGFDSKIMLGENEVGVAGFSAARDFEALVHGSLNASSVKITCPSVPTFNIGDEIVAYAAFSVVSDDPAVPGLLGEIQLERAVTMYPPVSLNTPISRLSAALEQRPWILPLAIFAMVFAAYLVFLSVGKLSSAKARKRRQLLEERRANELRETEERRYNGPVPVVGKNFMTR